MNAQQLRNSILQEAIEGRLVPQDPNDEPASVLLERIREEKKRLVKEGKLEGWETLVEEFAHARYGGGKRDSFENKETWKAAMRLMGVEEESF